MIITCASCLTKFSLDDSRVSAEGIKVRCSRCKHVFYVAPPPETKEEIFENLESFAKYHEDLMEPGEKKVGAPPEAKVQQEEEAPEKEEEQEAFLFTEKVPTEEVETSVPLEQVENLLAEEPV